jgi:flagellar assembly protein FliH
MPAVQKFLFDLSFDGPPPVPGEIGLPDDEAIGAAEKPDAAPPPSYSDEDLAAARAEGYVAGRAEALAEAEAQRESHTARALSAMAEGMRTLLAAGEQHHAAIQRDAVALMQAVVRKVAPSLARRAALDEVASFTLDCLRDVFDEPRVVLRVPDALFDAVQRNVAPLAASTGFAGKLVILADDTLAPCDCRVEWADGGAERDFARMWQDIDAAIVRTLDALTSAATGAAASETSPGETTP